MSDKQHKKINLYRINEDKTKTLIRQVIIEDEEGLEVTDISTLKRIKDSEYFIETGETNE
mgnify:CR=1 FL=1